MPQDQDLQPLLTAEVSPDEADIRHKAIDLVGRHWPELSGRIARWLGTAYREDDSLPGEVALTLMRRYGNGHGRLVAHLRRHGHVSPAEAKQVLFGEAKLVFREVLPRVIAYRRQCQHRVEWREDLPVPDDFGDASDTVAAEQLVGDIHRLMRVGELVWDSFCVAGLLDSTKWTDDQKWTAIAMMWGFSVDEIAQIRGLKTHTGGGSAASRAATRQIMRTVRRKGRVLADALAPEQGREYDLLERGR